MKKNELLTVTLVMIVTSLMFSSGALALTTTASQSGADSDEVMKDNTFVVEANGWTGDCSQATISFAGCSSCSLSGEDLTKSIGGGATSISWTTVSASTTASAQTVSVSVSSGCTLQQASSSSFDIVLPPSLSLSASTTASSVSAGGTFRTNLNVVNNGETTAQGVSLSVGSPFSASCTPISSIDEGQSAAESCIVTAPSTSGSRTVTFTASSTNADSDSDSFSITVTGGGDGDDTNGGGGGPGGGPSDENKTSRPTLVPGVGLRNNTKLQAAIEKVLAKGKMSAQARENLLRLSASITSDISTTRMFNVSEGKSRILTRMRYQGQNRVRNMIIYESVPKTFALNASLVTVSAPGATVEIAEDDPSWVIMYPEVSPNDEIVISYEVTGSKSSSNIDGMLTEIYAESLEEVPVTTTPVCTAGQKRCSSTTNQLQQCSSDGMSWEAIETCQYGCNAATNQCNTEQPTTGPTQPTGELPWMWIIVIIVIVVVLIIAGVVYSKQRSA